jgi:hypothetical protein
MPDTRRIPKLPCPPDDVWAGVAAGAISTPESERLLLHASECEACAAALRLAINATADDDEMEADRQAPAPDLRNLARRMAAQSRPSRRYLYAAAAIAVLLIAPLAWFWQSRSAPPLNALAAAYTVKRVVELRIPGADYAPVRIERGFPGDPPGASSERSRVAARRRPRRAARMASR